MELKIQATPDLNAFPETARRGSRRVVVVAAFPSMNYTLGNERRRNENGTKTPQLLLSRYMV
jgi:hypothetical protein